MGKIGIKTYMSLKDQGIQIRRFIDSNVNKQRKNLDGVECISLDEFINIKQDDYQVIIALDNDDRVVNELTQLGINNIFHRDDVSEYIKIEYRLLKDVLLLNRVKENIRDVDKWGNEGIIGK